MATERIKTLTDQRNRALASARQIVDDAESEGRSRLTGEEEARYERFLADHDRYQAAIDREQAEERLQAHTAGEAGKFVGHSAAPTEDDTFLTELAEALRPDRRDSVSWQLPAAEKRTVTPLTTGDTSTTKSAYVVPETIASEIEALQYAYSAVLQAGVRQITTEGAGGLQIPRVATAPTVNDGVEATAPTDSSYPVLDHTALGAYRKDAYVVVSEEEIASSSADILRFLVSDLSGAVAQAVAGALATGAGTTEPTGLFTAATTGKTAASQTTFTADEVIEAYQSVAAQFRPGLACVVSQAAESLLSRLKDQNDQYLWRAGLAAGSPPDLLGVPIYVDPQGPALTTGKKPIVFLQPRVYCVRWGMSGRSGVDISTEAMFTSWNRVLRIARWFDANRVGDPGGCKSLTLA